MKLLIDTSVEMQERDIEALLVSCPEIVDYLAVRKVSP